MIAARSGPLLVLAGAVAGWVMLRSLFLALSEPLPPLPPIAAVEPLPGPEWPFVLPGASPLPSPPPAAGMRWPVSLANAGSRLAADRPARLLAPARVTGPHDRRLVAAQSLLLARMLQHRRVWPERPADARPSLLSPRIAPDFAPARVPQLDRWSLAAGLYARRGGGAPALGSGATLGGSQAWVRAGWRADAGAPELFARVTSSGRRAGAAEAALGVAVRPVAGVPIDLVAERRQRITGDGRNAFAVYAVGGTSVAHRGWQFDGYGAAGMVGLDRRDLFAEGSATLARPVARVGRVELSAGGGIWGAAQPGSSRLDLGPTLSARGVPTDNARLALDWRQRVAGNARPDSGPALTLSLDF